MAAAGVSAGVALAGCAGGDNGADDTGADDTGADDDGDDPEPTDDEPEQGTMEYLENKYPGLEVHSADPENAEAAERGTYINFVTPAEEHFMRNRYLSPAIDEDDHTVELRLADETIDLSVEEIKHGYSTESVAHTMQCTGNGRSYFEPQVGGNPWAFGAVGNAVWTGTPVSEVLEEYGADTSDDMWLMAAGDEVPSEDDRVFARSIPMQKVMEDCLLVYQMNGHDLTIEHGHPVRLLVPGWYGCNSIKWLGELEVMDTMMYGDEWERYYNWQQNSYRFEVAGQDAEHHEEVDVFDTWQMMDNAAADDEPLAYAWDMLAKSVIGYPGEGDTVTPRTSDGQVEITGVAWAGDNEIEQVEVSTDGGETWDTAELFGPAMPGVDTTASWVQFRYMWTPDDDGEYTIVSRATDDQGRSQPRDVAHQDDELETVEDDAFPWEAGGYGNNAYWPHRVEVDVE
ncbi:molybdopterin-dependent oxidoreductase [Natrialbaceae archaeon AArc-T1-2]|uniref:molybdopterin-dependent oxidoreductase n=1 Tax=Natrialbaceae archaeon AArc-T1-2 TaxID=3053904 RepID=UPI00255AF18A|nr:molybdopterin-dependent oxidoreductase [Natrialbaceae archaeon AArc-T1-2]WIV66418.1 molybdopterin-dependent oxidoreductase [Natrialbaceae archaeon AArc-T1-2]